MGKFSAMMYSPIMKPRDLAIFMQAELVPHCRGSLQDLMNRTFAILSSQFRLLTVSVSLMSGASMVMLKVAIPVSSRLPSILTKMGRSWAKARS